MQDCCERWPAWLVSSVSRQLSPAPVPALYPSTQQKKNKSFIVTPSGTRSQPSYNVTSSCCYGEVRCEVWGVRYCSLCLLHPRNVNLLSQSGEMFVSLAAQQLRIFQSVMNSLAEASKSCDNCYNSQPTSPLTGNRNIAQVNSNKVTPGSSNTTLSFVNKLNFSLWRLWERELSRKDGEEPEQAGTRDAQWSESQHQLLWHGDSRLVQRLQARLSQWQTFYLGV